MAPNAFSASYQNGSLLAAAPTASSGITASKGIAAMSWNSRMAKLLRPVGVGRKFRSVMVATAIAVDDNAIANPATSAACQGKPANMPPIASATPQRPSCKLPPPNTWRRIDQSRFGSSSSPITNNISTTPNSEKCPIDLTSDTSCSPQGPIAAPAIR